MRTLFLLLCLALPFFPPAWAADKTIDDVFTVTAVNGGQATLSGKVDTVKAGDYLYFIRSPFKFKVLSTGTNSVVIELPNTNDVTASNIMVRKPSATIQKALDTEAKLKSALGE